LHLAGCICDLPWCVRREWPGRTAYANRHFGALGVAHDIPSIVMP
jgi:hypothetical protein